eukprot:3808464-Amphidinium_carterae.1
MVGTMKQMRTREKAFARSARDLDEFEGSEVLTPSEHAAYRHQAGLLQYVAGDRFDLRYSVKELMRSASSPTQGSKAKLKRVLRYVKGAPRVVYDYHFADAAINKDIIIDVDSDHAGCRSTRKSTTGLLARRTGHIIHELSATQPNEFYAIVKGIIITLYLCNLCRDLHVEVGQLRVRSDSSAGGGMISKLGVGKRARRIDTQFLFAQTVIQD